MSDALIGLDDLTPDAAYDLMEEISAAAGGGERFMSLLEAIQRCTLRPINGKPIDRFEAIALGLATGWRLRGVAAQRRRARGLGAGEAN